MATSAGASASDASLFLVGNDEEIYKQLILQEKDVTDLLGPLFQRIRQDPIDTDEWSKWEQQCRNHGIQVPSSAIFAVEKAHIHHKIPESFDTLGGKAHLKSIQALLKVEEAVAVQITLSCMRDVPSVEANQGVFGSHALFEKVVDYAFRQRIARIRVLAEALRAENDESSRYKDEMQRLLQELDQKSELAQGVHRGIFQPLLLTACWTDTDFTRDQLLPAKDLWVQNKQENRDEMTKDADWRALCHRIIARHQHFILRARVEALEALIVLLYTRMKTTRADYALLLMALNGHQFFANQQKFGERMGHLVAMICVEACMLQEIQGDQWSENHVLLTGTDPAASSETLGLCRLLEISIHSEESKPQGLAALAFGCLLHLGGRKEGFDLAQMAVVGGCKADLYLEETMKKLVDAPSMEPGILNLVWFEERDAIDNLQPEAETLDTELTTSCMLYATIGRELLIAVVRTFHEALLDPRRESFAENMNAMANLMKVVHQNSALLCMQTWDDWLGDVENTNETPSPISRLIYLSKDLAVQCLGRGGKENPVEFLQGVAPLLKLASCLVCNADMVCEVLTTLPQSLIHSALVACLTSVDPESTQIWRMQVLESVCTIACLARSDKSRSLLRQGIDGSDGSFGPLFLFRIASVSGTQEALRLVSALVARLLPGAPVRWLLQATQGLESILQTVSGNIMGRNKDATEALVTLAYGLIAEMNSILFCKGIRDDVAVSALNVITRALSGIADVLISSTSNLSGRLFDGKSLPYAIATKILVTLGDAFIMLRPVPLAHPSRRIQSVVQSMITSIMDGTSRKAGIGDSVLYFATLPAACGITTDLKNTAKDADLARTVKFTSSLIGASTKLDEILISRIKSMDDIPVHLDNIQDNHVATGSRKEILEASVAALRFLILIFDHFKYMGHDTDDVTVLNPYERILSHALPLPSVRQASEIARAWSVSGIRYVDLLFRQLDTEERCVILPTLALLGSCFKETSPAFKQTIASTPLFMKLVKVTFEKLGECDTTMGNSTENRKWQSAATCLSALNSCLDSQIKVFEAKREAEKCKILMKYVVAYGTSESARDVEEISICGECLLLLLTLRKQQLASGDDAYFTMEDAFLTSIASLALIDVSLLSNVRRSGSMSQVAATALQILTLEMHQLRHATLSGNPSIFKAIRSALGDPRLLFAWSEKAFVLRSVRAFVNGMIAAHDSVQATVDFDAEALPHLVELFGIKGALSSSETLFVWLKSMQRTDCAAPELFASLSHLRLIHSNLYLEIARTRASRDFAAVLSNHLNHIGLSNSDFTSEMSKRVVASLSRNLSNVEPAAGIDSVYLLVGEMSAVADGLACFLVQLLSGDEGAASQLAWTCDEIIGILNSLRRNAGQLLAHSTKRREHCLVVDKLLLSAAKLTSYFEEKASRQEIENNQFLDIQADFARISCKVLRRLEESAMWEPHGTDESKMFSRCFITCVDFLCLLCNYVKSRREPKHFFSRISKVMVETNVTSALVYSVSNERSRDNIGTEGVLAVFHLFSVIATFQSKQLLSYLLQSGIRPALMANFHPKSDGPSVVAGVAMRGYVSLRNTPRWSPFQNMNENPVSLQIGQASEHHEIQISSTDFIAAALRSVAASEYCESWKDVRSVALDYLGSCGQSLLECLEQISNISFDPDVSELTFRSIKEATSTLAFVVELCRPRNIDEFKRRFPELFAACVDRVKGVACSMCTYLGASGASRELFRGLADDETSICNSTISPLTQLLSGGLSNERHEAIRFSHFVSRCSAAVTDEEHEMQTSYPDPWAPSVSRRASVDDPLSESALERKSKASVTNHFALTLEEQGGKCLFQALQVIWKTHPINSSFVMFSVAELRMLDMARLVAVGTSVRFRYVGNDGYQGLYQGEVQHIDVVNRMWGIAVSGETASNELLRVPMDNTVGIEDPCLRKPALHFSAAPENSTEMEQLGQTMSIGHLIAGLRWCHELSVDAGPKPSTSRLAEILSILLSTEVSLARETHQKEGSGLVGSDTTNKLALQLLDLFGVEEEICADLDHDLYEALRRDGRVRQLVSNEVWNATRDQVREELDRAVAIVKERRQKKRNRSLDGDSWLGSYRRSPSSRSPFRQLSG